MDNTTDTPMDYKQFEGHTPGPWQSDFEASGNGNYSVLDVEGWRVAWVGDNNDTRLIAAAPNLLKENQELKLGLQKQKELNVELVKMVEFYTKEIKYLKDVNRWDEGLKETKNEYANATIRAYKDFISSLESLIKKSH